MVNTATLNTLLDQTKNALVAHDYNFAAEIKSAEKHYRDPSSSMVARRALRDFFHHMGEISQQQWERYAILYQEHRGSYNLTQIHLRVEREGKEIMKQIGEIIRSSSIFDILSVKEGSGDQLPGSALIICALAWEVENLSQREH